jgi:isocitrate lyase
MTRGRNTVYTAMRLCCRCHQRRTTAGASTKGGKFVCKDCRTEATRRAVVVATLTATLCWVATRYPMPGRAFTPDQMRQIEACAPLHKVAQVDGNTITCTN